MERLPDTTGMKNEVILQQTHRYGYDRAYTVPGSKLVIVGDHDGCTPEQIEGAIGPETAAVAYLVKADADTSSVSLEDTVDLAHSHDVPVIADAAAQIYPLDYFRRNAQSADLVCFGGKYMGAPHSTGFACGKEGLMDAVTAHGFIGPRPLGRGMKVDRQEIIGLVAAVEDWFTMDHEERLVEYGAKFTPIEDALRGVSSVKETKVFHSNTYWGVGLHVVLDTEFLGKGAQHVVSELDEGNPRIRAAAAEDDTILINVHNLGEGDEHIVAGRLKILLESS
jgi:L-seryl-tRNA(Ser) seleniumtransferase